MKKTSKLITVLLSLGTIIASTEQKLRIGVAIGIFFCVLAIANRDFELAQASAQVGSNIAIGVTANAPEADTANGSLMVAQSVSAANPYTSAQTAVTATIQYGLEWPGNGTVRRMLYWSNPFPIYDATYIFKVYPRKKTTGLYRYYTTFFWGNNGTFTWDAGNANTYYGMHPYPIPAPGGPGQWEISVYSNDFVTGNEVEWNRWYTQAIRVWRESTSITHHEFY